MDIFLDADPNSKKKLTQWLVDTYISGGFRWEDIQSGSNSKVFYTLSLYIKHKSKLDSDNRDLQVNANHIGQYDTLGSVYKDIAPFIKSDKSSRSVKRDEQAQAHEESKVLIKSDSGEFTTNSLTVVIPETEYASKWWGRGTQWCTAGNKDNMFNRYYRNGPLFIIIINGVKTQLHVNLVNKNCPVQFMDEHDGEVEVKFIEDNWELLSPILEWAVRQNGNALVYIPKKILTPKLCLEAVKQDGMILSHIPKEFKTVNLCTEAVKRNGDALCSVPELLRTPFMCLEVVKQNGRALKYIPGYLRKLELCLEAIRQNGRALIYVPEYLRTAELCLEAVMQNGRALKYVPGYLRKLELCLEALRKDCRALGSFPEYLRTAELFLEAVRQDGKALEYIQEALRTEELCIMAVRNNGGALYYVPEDLRTAELCLEAVRQEGCTLLNVPEQLRTAELCLEAVKQDGIALAWVPEALMTEELCLETLRQNSEALDYIPEQYKEHLSLLVKKVWDLDEIKELQLQLKYSNHLKLKADNP